MTGSPRIRQLITEAQDLPEGPERVAALEEAVRMADAVGDEPLACEARLELVDTANWSGRPDLMIVALTWCFAYADRIDDYRDYPSLLWRQKWLISSLTDFHRISQSQIVSMEDDFSRRLEESGWNQRPAEYLRMNRRLDFGDIAGAAAHHDRWRSIPRDGMADCQSCELDSEAWYELQQGDAEKAVQLSMPLINRERPGCRSVPHRTYYKATIGLLTLGRIDEAQALYPRAMRMVGGKHGHLGDVVAQLLLLLRVGEQAKALRQVDRHLLIAAADASDRIRKNFFAAAGLTLEAIAAKSSRKRKLRLPADHPLARGDNTYDTGELADWYRSEAHRLAIEFDRRDNNDFHTCELAGFRDLAGL